MKIVEHKYTNQLINQSSPYLLQHAHNPVNWYPWGEEALNKAKEEDKLLLISIGYAACHWCHVMEHESFEDEKVAELMNENFICIKVDREERPDIDQIYMSAVQLMTGSGGWPLNCIALPDGRPIYGGTYFRREQWKNVLKSLAHTYENERQKALKAADDITKGIAETDIVNLKEKPSEFLKSELKDIVEPWKKYFDTKEGGNNRAPKFPLPNSYEFLLQYYYYTKDKEALEHVVLTLNKMAAGGIYDQIAGGFARYSVDAYWKVPHFEKMLYDNGQLISLYAKAYQLTKNKEYKRIVYQTLEFIEREMSSPEGGFYSSLDADSEGEEGKFYVWEKKEIDQALGKDAALFCDYYNVNALGNWEHKQNILLKSENIEKLVKKHKLSENALIKKVDELNKKLLKERSKRVRPGLDDKILTSWNALMLDGYVDAYRVFNELSFLEKAKQNADFLLKYMIKDDFRLDRNFKDEKSSINAFLDDYSFSISAFINLYQATFDKKYLEIAKTLMEYAINHFFDKESGMFYYTSDVDKALISRKMEINDNVIPSSNSEMARNLFYLGKIYYNEDYIEKSRQMLFNVKKQIPRSGAYYSNWAALLTHFIYSPNEVAIMGNNSLEIRKELDKFFLPSIIVAGSTKDSDIPLLKARYQKNSTKIYVCKDKVCKMPVERVDEALKLIND
ncbi:MAG: thioredoxin domain-containing protein [Bacteroidetes bacterium]|nr:MAG: thioredoxin domain-containing protein [Bacteroidota bacterium]